MDADDFLVFFNKKGCDHWTLRMFGLAGWEEEKTRDLLGRVMEEYQDSLLRSCIKVYV